MSRSWRPDLYVVARFLEKLGDGAPCRKGSLQPAVRLNYDLFRKYLDVLEAAGLVLVEGAPRHQTVRVTPRGQELRRRMEEWIEAVFTQR